MPQRNSTEGTCLTGRLVIVEGHTVAEIPVESRYQQRTLFAKCIKDGIEKCIAVEPLALTHAGERQLHDV